jgi:hypothetical protein
MEASTLLGLSVEWAQNQGGNTNEGNNINDSSPANDDSRTGARSADPGMFKSAVPNWPGQLGADTGRSDYRP